MNPHSPGTEDHDQWETSTGADLARDPFPLTMERGDLIFRSEGANGGYWISRKSDQRDHHRCPIPPGYPPVGSFWQCPEGHLWHLVSACNCNGRPELHYGGGSHTTGRKWRPATWRQRRYYGPGMRKARPEMAGPLVPRMLKPPPPSGRSPISPPTATPGTQDIDD